MLNDITTWKKYLKDSLNVFFNRKMLMMTKKINQYDRFFESNRNFTTKHMLKLLKIPGFLRF